MGIGMNNVKDREGFHPSKEIVKSPRISMLIENLYASMLTGQFFLLKAIKVPKGNRLSEEEQKHFIIY